MNLKEYIKEIPDFPKEGILFRDISPLIANPKAWDFVIDALSQSCIENNVDAIVGIEARGFIVGAALAKTLGIGFIPIRKKGKVAGEKVSIEYKLEYGSDILELNTNAINQELNIFIVDDLLATGGTIKAAIELLKLLNAKITGCGFIVELEELNGRNNIDNNLLVQSIIKY